ncbi:hypothetical protein KBD13_01570 [Patescibacteria group bacterium]|nr:hypothetical protein [Patescibacteria group bacterium]
MTFKEYPSATKETPQQRFETASEREKLEVLATYWGERHSALAKETEAKLKAAKASGDARVIQAAERAHKNALERFNKAYGIMQVFHDTSIETNVHDALRDQYTKAEARLAENKRVIRGMPDSAWAEEDAKITALLDALEFIERENAPTSGTTSTKTFRDWLPVGYASGLIREAIKEKPAAPTEKVHTPVRIPVEAYRAPAPAAARPPVAPRPPDRGVEQREKERLIEAVMENGAFSFFTSLTDVTKNGSGFQSVDDPRWHKKLGSSLEKRSPSSETVSYIENGTKIHREIGRILQEKSVSEFVRAEPFTETRYRTEDREVNAGGIRGFFGGTKQDVAKVSYQVPVEDISTILPGHTKHEPAVTVTYETTNEAYTDYTGRAGNVLKITMLLPASVAKALLTLGKKDPAVFRAIAERVALERTGVITKELWHKGEGLTLNPEEREHRKPLSARELEARRVRPPYEAWKAAQGGVEKILIQDWTAPGAERGLLKESDIVTFPR